MHCFDSWSISLGSRANGLATTILPFLHTNDTVHDGVAFYGTQHRYKFQRAKIPRWWD
jgi:hypothetical protein